MRKVAVTGGSGGLGRYVVARLEAAGLETAVVDRDPSTEIVADLADLDETRRVADILTEAGVDGLVNNAGAWTPGARYPQAAEAAWLATMTLDLLGPMLLVQRLWDGLEAVVDVGSSGGEGDAPYGSPEDGAA
jgi:NAD(P)-dependent dehydrogenase (short-subunit alcohol dehydrogenase family)